MSLISLLILSQVKKSSSLKCQPEPLLRGWKPSEYVTDSYESSVLAAFRLGNAQLGNKDTYGVEIRPDLVDGTGRLTECPSCRDKGIACINNEVHMFIECQSLHDVRETIGVDKKRTLGEFIREEQRKGKSNEEVFKAFLQGGDKDEPYEFAKRGQILSNMRDVFRASWMSNEQQ